MLHDTHTKENTMRKRGRVDANQKTLVAAARAMGFSVAVTSAMGSGFPDIVLGKNGVNYLVEIKDGDKTPSQRKLTIDEQEFKDSWRGRYDIIESIDDLKRLYDETCRASK